MKVCLLIPIYNHKDHITGIVRSLAPADLPCLIVDDGSDEATQRIQASIAMEVPGVNIERLSGHRGRGAALRHGYRLAWSRGFSHVIQLDADGQHDSADVPTFLAAARRRPDALVLGAPIFDATAPPSRRYGRRISIVWAHLETLSHAIQDPLCGFRCLPLAPTITLLARTPLGDQMDFDPELAVRLYWDGLPIINIPTRVRYFPDGVSHFRPVRDNVLISVAHAKLCTGMVRRLPQLLSRSRRASS